MATHNAAVLVAKGQPFELQSRPTPKPGPGELLIEVKSVALNPADGILRDHDLLPVPTIPTVIGFDLAGVVLAVGDNVPTPATHAGSGPVFQPGVTRVAAYAGFYWTSCDPDYGAFQERCLVPWQHAVPLPDDDRLSWNQAATLPVAFEVPLNTWDLLGIPRLGEATAASVGADVSGNAQKPETHKREALLIWGASSSVGTGGVQSARLLKEDANSSIGAVYATAGAANLNYVASLGADRVFDYKDQRVVDAVIAAAKEDGLVIRHCFLAMGELALCQAVLKSFVGDDSGKGSQMAKIGSAPPLPQDAEEMHGVDTVFVLPSMDQEERLGQFQYWMGTWLREKLISGTVKPSPEPKVMGKGLESINAVLDILARGISCTKLVIEIAE